MRKSFFKHVISGHGAIHHTQVFILFSLFYNVITIMEPICAKRKPKARFISFHHSGSLHILLCNAHFREAYEYSAVSSTCNPSADIVERTRSSANNR